MRGTWFLAKQGGNGKGHDLGVAVKTDQASSMSSVSSVPNKSWESVIRIQRSYRWSINLSKGQCLTQQIWAGNCKANGVNRELSLFVNQKQQDRQKEMPIQW